MSLDARSVLRRCDILPEHFAELRRLLEHLLHPQITMSKLLRGLAAGWGAKKLGGGCLTTIIVFALLWYLLGHFQIFR